MEPAFAVATSAVVAILLFAIVCTLAAIIGALIERQRVRSKFSALLAHQRQRCRPLTDDEDLTFDDTMQLATVLIIERVEAQVCKG